MTRHYFSNGTEGSIWMAQNCDRCLHDHSTHGADPDYDNGCKHVLNMVLGVDDPALIGSNYPEPMVCVDMMRCPCGRGPDDPGVPIAPEPDPNQGLLFDPETVAMGVTMGAYLDAMPVEAKP